MLHVLVASVEVYILLKIYLSTVQYSLIDVGSRMLILRLERSGIREPARGRTKATSALPMPPQNMYTETATSLKMHGSALNTALMMAKQKAKPKPIQ